MEVVLKQNRLILDPDIELPIVKGIIESFASIEETVEAINVWCSVDEHRGILMNWMANIWGDEVTKQKEQRPERNNSEDNEDGNEAEGSDGSVFYDSEVGYIPDRLQAVTPQSGNAGSSSPQTFKSEFAKSPKGSSEVEKQGFKFTTPTTWRAEKNTSEVPDSKEKNDVMRNPSRYHPSTRSSFKSKSECAKLATDHRNKGMNRMSETDWFRGYAPSTTLEARPVEETRPKRVQSSPETSSSKRIKSFGDRPTLNRIPKAPSKQPTANASDERATKQISAVNDLDALKSIGVAIEPNLMSNAEFVSRYWQETVSNFPEGIQSMPTLDRLAYYFRMVEMLKRENQILKKDARERRRTMVLLGEKIKLINQPVVGDIIHSLHTRKC